MKIGIYFLFCLFTFNFWGCQSQNEKSGIALNFVEIKKLYEKYQEVRYKHEEANEELFSFEKSVKEIFNNRELSNVFLDSVVKIGGFFSEKSFDGKLLISSWEVINLGCDHSYRSILRYKDDNNFYVEYYSGNQKDVYSLQDEVRKTYPFKIHDLEQSKYLIEGTRLTCQSGRIIEFDILDVNEENLNNANSIKDMPEFVYLATRSDTIYPEFDHKQKVLSLPIREPIFNEGEDTGFTRVTEQRQNYKYIDGAFVLQKP